MTFDFNQPPLEMSVPKRTDTWYSADEDYAQKDKKVPELAPLHIKDQGSDDVATEEESTPTLHQSEFQAPTQQKQAKVCRGCSNAIIGKSVRAKDGTLTGRWHKECLNCRDCSKPLAGADKIHVLNDQPFCARCYHVANKTTCAMCLEGIEGACLETRLSSDDGQPYLYHVNCLQCNSCGIKLQHSYFDVNGVPYCAEHAFSSLPDDQMVHKRYTQYMMI